MAERVARKKGQHRGSSSHSDLYTDENPKGTIHGLKFATQKDAKASVNKIKSSGKSHAHKIQAAIAMEQRAKAAGKVSAAGEYRKFINMMKKKTKAKNENITIPIKVGDTVLGGKFKNKRIVVKSIGKNDKGDITINGRPLLKFRIVKENIEVEFPEDMPMDENSYLKNAQSRLKKVYKHLGVEYGQTRRGDKYVQINYIPKSVPQSQSPEFVKVFYDSDEELQKIGKSLKLKLKESVSSQSLQKLNLGLKKINRKFKGASLDGKTIDIELHPGHNRDSEIHQIYDLLKKLKLDKNKTSIFNESVNENVNTFFYDDMKKYIYKNRGKINKVMKHLPDNKKYDFLEKLYVKLFKGPTYRMAEKDIKGKGKELHQMLVKDKYIKEVYYDNLGNKCPGPVTLDGRCLGGRNTYQKEGVGMNRTLHKDVGPHDDDELNEVGIFKISQFTKGIIPQGRLDTHTPEKKKEAIKLIKNFHSMLNAFWRENDIPFRARLR